MNKAEDKHMSVQKQNRMPTTANQLDELSKDAKTRVNPALLRIHADDQDKKSLCLLWVVFFGFALAVGILANLAAPGIYVRQESHPYTTNETNCEFPYSPRIQDLLIICDDYYNSSQLGDMVLGWNPSNQFALTYLDIIPTNLTTPLNFTVNLTIFINKIHPYFNKQINQTVVEAQQQLSATSQILKFDSSSADSLYASDGETIIGYRTQLAIIPHLDFYPIFIGVGFNETANSTLISSLDVFSYAINRQFTYYAIIVRYIFFGLSLVALILYFIRYVKIPKEKRVTEQFLIAIASILLVMFNDPFYPLTILKPNGASVFFSILFSVNLIVFLFFIWLVTADRINEQDGQIETSQITKKKIAYAAALWLQLLIAMMVYSMQQINTTPILASNLQAAYIAAKVIIILSLLAFIFYIGFRYVQICRSEQPKLWRSNIFMLVSSIFIFLIFILVAGNSLIPYNYSGSMIMLVYGLVNLYVYFLQYMFTITRNEAELLGKDVLSNQDSRHTLSEGAIDGELDHKGQKKNENAGIPVKVEEYRGIDITELTQNQPQFEVQ